MFLGASFDQPVSPLSTPVYGFLNVNTRTEFYTIDPKEASIAQANPLYASEGIVFRALPPYHRNHQLPALLQLGNRSLCLFRGRADVQFFTSRGYTVQGFAWSVL